MKDCFDLKMVPFCPNCCRLEYASHCFIQLALKAVEKYENDLLGFVKYINKIPRSNHKYIFKALEFHPEKLDRINKLMVLV